MKTDSKSKVERFVEVALARECAEIRGPTASDTPTDAIQHSGGTLPISIKTILVPTDFSPLAARAVGYARRFAEHFGARLILLHVTEPVAYAPGYGPLSCVEEVRSTRRRMAEDSLAQFIADSEPPNLKAIDCRGIVTEGDSAGETDRMAQEYRADLIIIASHGFSGLTHLLLGSTAEKIVRSAPCPVLVVRENQRDFTPVEQISPRGDASNHLPQFSRAKTVARVPGNKGSMNHANP